MALGRLEFSREKAAEGALTLQNTTAADPVAAACPDERSNFSGDVVAERDSSTGASLKLCSSDSQSWRVGLRANFVPSQSK